MGHGVVLPIPLHSPRNPRELSQRAESRKQTHRDNGRLDHLNPFVFDVLIKNKGQELLLVVATLRKYEVLMAIHTLCATGGSTGKCDTSQHVVEVAVQARPHSRNACQCVQPIRCTGSVPLGSVERCQVVPARSWAIVPLLHP